MTIPRPLVFILCAIPWAVAAYGLYSLVTLRFPSSGTFVAESRLDGKNPWIFPFLPSERVSTPGKQEDGWIGQRITGDPVYATAHVPGPYETADVSVEYRVNHQPLVEFGVVRDAAGKGLEMTPLYSSQLDSADWSRVNDGSALGFVRTGVSPSRLSGADPAGVVVWDATSTMPLLSDPASDATTTQISLRGSHDFYFVPAGEAVRAIFTFQFVNRKEGSDIIAFRVFRGDTELPDQAFALNMRNEKQMGSAQLHAVSIPHAEPGVYRVSFLAPDDVFIRSIETTSRHWVVGPRVYFGDAVGFLKENSPGNLWTNSRHLAAETFHVEGFQEFSFADTKANVARTHTAVRLDRTDVVRDPILLSAPKGDIRFILDGYGAFRPDAFFEPKPRRFTDATHADAEHVQAVRTTYQQPEKLEDGWMRSTIFVAIRPDTDTLRFVLASPGIASRLGSVDIRRMSIAYHRPAGQPGDWLKTIRQELANAWHRL